MCRVRGRGEGEQDDLVQNKWVLRVGSSILLRAELTRVRCARTSCERSLTLEILVIYSASVPRCKRGCILSSISTVLSGIAQCNPSWGVALSEGP